ncbi:hypothetical protein Bca101_057543 [Brassica carinata]
MLIFYKIHITFHNHLCRFTRFDEVPDIFTHVGRPSGEMQEIWLSEKDYKCAHAYILRNCEYFQPFERMFEDFLTAKYPDLSEKDLSAKRADEYHLWVKDYVNYWSNTHQFSPWVKDIANGPVNKARTWPIYFTRGFLFHTQKQGEGRKTCNFGVKKPKQLWLNVLKVNPRGIISGEYEDKERTLLQQENDDAVLMTTIEDLAVDHLVHARVQPINLDIDVEDAEPEDEFQCNRSSSSGDDEDGEVPY